MTVLYLYGRIGYYPSSLLTPSLLSYVLKIRQSTLKTFGLSNMNVYFQKVWSKLYPIKSQSVCLTKFKRVNFYSE